MGAAALLNPLVAEIALSDSRGNSVPEWARQGTLVQRNKLLTIVCTGRGPSVDQARAYAMRNCRNAAADTLQDQYSVRGVTVESDKSIGFHQEVAVETTFTGLTCSPVKDEVFSSSGGLFDVWLKCEFDLTKTQKSDAAHGAFDQTEIVDSTSGTASNDSESHDVSSNRDKLVQQREVDIIANDRPGNRLNFSGVIDIVSVPTCEKILIRGAKSRSISCSESGVTSLTVTTEDTDLVIQSTGYLSKTFKMPKKLRRHDSIQVILEPHD